MPQYEVTDNVTGKTLILEGEGGPPTEQELHQIFGGQQQVGPSMGLMDKIGVGAALAKPLLGRVMQATGTVPQDPNQTPLPLMKDEGFGAFYNPIASQVNPMNAAMLGPIGAIMKARSAGLALNAAKAGIGAYLAKQGMEQFGTGAGGLSVTGLPILPSGPGDVESIVAGPIINRIAPGTFPQKEFGGTTEQWRNLAETFLGGGQAAGAAAGMFYRPGVPQPTGVRSELTPQDMAAIRAMPAEPYRGFPEVPLGRRLAQFSESTQATQQRRAAAEEQLRRAAEGGRADVQGMPFLSEPRARGEVTATIGATGVPAERPAVPFPMAGPERQLSEIVASTLRQREAIEQAKRAAEGSQGEVPGMPFVSQEKGQGPVSGAIQTKMQSGVNPEDIRPAVRYLGRLLVGRVGDTHADILKQNGIDPKDVTHYDPNRGFVDSKSGNWLDRQETAKIIGKSTADAGGADSMDLPGAGQATLLRSIGYDERQVEDAIRELRTSNVSKEAPPGNLQKMGEEVRAGAETQSLARIEPKGQGQPKQELAPLSTPMGMGRSLKNLVNIYLGRSAGKGRTGMEASGGIPVLGKAKLEDLYPDELRQAHDYLKGLHEERLKQTVEGEKGEVAKDMENTLWQEVRNKLFSLGLKKGENVTGATLQELQRERERIQGQLDQQFQSGGKKLQDKAEQALMRDLQGVTELIKKQEEGEGTTRFYSGLSLEPIVDLLKKADNDRKTLFKMASLGYRKINDQVFAKRDAVDNAPLVTANRAENHLDLTATKDFGKQAKEADNAVIAVLATHGNRAELRNLATLVAGKHKDAEAAIKFADANWPKLQNLVKHVEAIDAQNVAMAKANGVFIPTIADYLKQAYKNEGQGLFFGRRGGAGIGIGSKLPRKYPNIFEAIADGREPISLSAKALVGKRTAEIQREINTKLWLDSFRTIKDKNTGEPIVTDLKHMGPGRPAATKEGYSRVEGLDVGIHQGYEPLFITATGKSIAEGSRTMQALLQTEGGIKHGMLAFDFYHMFRIAMLGGRAGVGVRGLPFGSMGRRGISLLDYSEKDLAEAVRQGKAPRGALAYQNEIVDVPQGKFTRRQVGSLQLKAGGNVGKHSEALYTTFVRDFPGLKQTIGKTNRYIFDTLSRGVMYEAFQIEFERLANANPKMPVEQVARNVARDLNFRLGNIGRQGLIKSRSMQDITSLLLLAPRWVESMAQSEVRAAGQVGKALGTLSPTKVGTLGKSTATLVGAFFVATQALNYLINGHSTFDNPDNKGHEVDLWIPPLKEGEKGFHVSPFSVPMELTHDMLRYTRAGQTPADALARIASNKMSPLAQGVGTFISGKNYKGEEVSRTTGALGATLNPFPLPIRQGIQSVKEKSIAPFERQTFSLLGVKAEPETTYEQRSREAEGKDLIERAVESGVRRIGQPQRSPAERLLSQTASSRSMMRRGTDMKKTLSKADQNWLDSRGLFLPGFDNKVKIGGENVNLTDKEMTRYTELIKVGYEEAIKVLRDNYDEASSEDRQKLFSSAFTEARKAAREQLMSELISESEKDRKGRKFKALQ